MLHTVDQRRRSSANNMTPRGRFCCQTSVIVEGVLLALVVSGVAFAAKGSSAPQPSSVRTKTLVDDFWLFSLVKNVLGYCVVIVPGYLIIRYTRRHAQSILSSRASQRPLHRLLKLFVFGNNEEEASAIVDVEIGRVVVPSAEFGRKADVLSFVTKLPRPLLLLLCFFGLMISYLTWGILQEKIMTKAYGAEHDRFRDSQFLVFVNRILAFLLSGIYILWTYQPLHRAPLYKYSYCSFSNIMSSWFQYESLKYVTFPTQVLVKSCKVLPVMLMAKLVSGKVHKWHEFATAGVISLGMAIFSLSRIGETFSNRGVMSTGLSGLLILVGYLTFDSFTSNWQSALYSGYKMSSSQMMCAVNLFSVIFTLVSLAEQGKFGDSIAFAVLHPDFFFDIFLLSICSASGQTFVYFTIEQFGPVNFTIMMTVRQAAAIVLSCVIYGHVIQTAGFIGIILVFTGVGLRIYRSLRTQSKSGKPNSLSSTTIAATPLLSQA